MSSSSSAAVAASGAAAPAAADGKAEAKAEAKVPLEDPSLAFSRAQVAKAKADDSGKVFRVYCDGIFDLFHLGHMNMLKQAKHALGDPKKTFLLVGVCGDTITHKEKGLTVMSENVRYESVRHCKWVDEVIPDAPWVITPEFLTKHNIDFVAHDAIPYASSTSGASDVYSGVKQMGKFLETQRTDGISTSDIIVTIVKDYDAYVDRNLKRGYDKKSLNVGRTWEVRMVAHEKSQALDAALDELTRRRQDLTQNVRRFVSEFNRRAFTAESAKDAEESKRQAVERAHIVDNAKGVVRTSGSLCWAFAVTVVKVASYLNCLSYVDRCRRYNKKDD